MVQGAVRKSNFSKYIVYFVLFCVFIFVTYFFINKPQDHSPTEVLADSEQQESQNSSNSPRIENFDVKYTINEGDVLANVFSDNDIPYDEILALEQAGNEVFNFTNIKAGRDIFYSLYEQGSDLTLKDVQYQPDYNRIIKAEQTSGGWLINEEKIIYDINEVKFKGDVDVSLYLSGIDQGVDEKAILLFADMFAWDVDFALETRVGDQFKLIYEEKYLDSEFVTSGQVLAGLYVNDGKEFYGFYFKGEDNKSGYYDKDGNSLQKAFLRAPVNYRYVSSGFTNSRFHPITGQNLPHNGVDYAAAYGTPIISVAEGVVTNFGWEGAYGNRIEIRHTDQYSSQYSHMSSYVTSLKIGDRVIQGDTIGYVGSTGYSTGNHVHYSMTDYGKYVDPAKIDVPDGDPISEENKGKFLQVVNKMLEQLNKF